MLKRSPRPRPPDEVVSALALVPRERVLAWARGAAGEWYVGTNLALHLPAADGAPRRLGWEEVERADWQRDTDRLAIVEVTEWGAPERTTVVSVEEPGHLLELLRERVTKSVICSVFARVRGSLGISVVGRRAPSGDGPVIWSYVVSAGLDPADPDVVRVAEATLDEARHEVENL